MSNFTAHTLIISYHLKRWDIVKLKYNIDDAIQTQKAFEKKIFSDPLGNEYLILKECKKYKSK